MAWFNLYSSRPAPQAPLPVDSSNGGSRPSAPPSGEGPPSRRSIDSTRRRQSLSLSRASTIGGPSGDAEAYVNHPQMGTRPNNSQFESLMDLSMPPPDTGISARIRASLALRRPALTVTQTSAPPWSSELQAMHSKHAERLTQGAPLGPSSQLVALLDQVDEPARQSIETALAAAVGGQSNLADLLNELTSETATSIDPDRKMIIAEALVSAACHSQHPNGLPARAASGEPVAQLMVNAGMLAMGLQNILDYQLPLQKAALASRQPGSAGRAAAEMKTFDAVASEFGFLPSFEARELWVWEQLGGMRNHPLTGEPIDGFVQRPTRLAESIEASCASPDRIIELCGIDSQRDLINRIPMREQIEQIVAESKPFRQRMSEIGPEGLASEGVTLCTARGVAAARRLDEYQPYAKS